MPVFIWSENICTPFHYSFIKEVHGKKQQNKHYSLELMFVSIFQKETCSEWIKYSKPSHTSTASVLQLPKGSFTITASYVSPLNLMQIFLQ